MKENLHSLAWYLFDLGRGVMASDLKVDYVHEKSMHIFYFDLDFFGFFYSLYAKLKTKKKKLEKYMHTFSWT